MLKCVHCLSYLFLINTKSELQALRMDDGLDDPEEDPFTAKMSFEVRKDRGDEVINIPPTGQTSWTG